MGGGTDCSTLGRTISEVEEDKMEYLVHFSRMLVTLMFIGSFFFIYFLLFLIAVEPILRWGVRKVLSPR